MKKKSLWIVFLGMLVIVSCAKKEPKMSKKHPAIVLEEFVFEKGPTPSCHASTIAETPNGLVAAWFGGKEEGAQDVDIWLSHKKDGFWSKPVAVAEGTTPEGQRYPCWNPVLFQVPNGDLLLFYKVGPNPREWWGMMKRSSDSGQTWSAAEKLPKGILGPIKDKPILLKDGTLLCGSSEELGGWRVHIEGTSDWGKTWWRTPDLNDPKVVEAIQPTLLQYADGRLQFLCRTRQKRIYQSWSDDNGKTWKPLTPTELPNPSSGIDAVTLRDGRQLLVYNPTEHDRVPLSVAVSKDGHSWHRVLDLEPAVVNGKKVHGEFSYPAVIQTADGLVHITYTWRRERIKHVVLNPSKISD